jgi:hypothetical protein
MGYQSPEVRELGSIEQVTRGQYFSNPDGMSGGVGNNGDNGEGNSG